VLPVYHVDGQRAGESYELASGGSRRDRDGEVRGLAGHLAAERFTPALVKARNVRQLVEMPFVFGVKR